MIIWILIYIVGCILSFGRFTANHYAFLKQTPNLSQNKWWVSVDDGWLVLGLIMVLFSWLGFLAGIMVYTVESGVMDNTNVPFLKFNYND